MAIQVQEATKDGQGNPLSILRRQFISFSYGGRNIEDFDLLAVFNNDRFTKEIYSPFTDTTTELTDLDGQIFWRSKYKPTTLSFTLATDGITAKQYEDFKKWFVPGETKKLILSEYHNRYAYARVLSAPVISLLPFEKEISIKVNNSLKRTKSTLYKGEIEIEFVLDDPYWYSINSFFTSDKEEDMTEEDIKVLYEDGIPHKNMFIEKGIYYLAKGTTVEVTSQTSSVVNQTTEPEVLNNYLYNCGSAPAKPIISFSFKPTIEGNNLIFPSIAKDNYAFITIGEKTLKFTAPSILTSYLTAREIVDKKGYGKGKSAIDLKNEIRSNISHSIARAKIIACIEDKDNSESGLLTEKFGANFQSLINSMCPDNSNFTLKVDMKTGQIILRYTIDGKEREEDAGDMIKSSYFTLDGNCYPNSEGNITSQECFLITHSAEIEDLAINFEYTYL